MANVMAGVCGVFALICAKESGYKVEEVETFEHQALDLDSQAISLLGTVASVPRSPVWL